MTPRRRLALAHLTVETATPLEAARAAAAAGFDGVGLRITGFAPGEGRTMVGDRSALRALRALVDGEGMEIVNVCSYRLSPAVTSADYRPVFDACAEIGAKTMLATCIEPDQGRQAALLAGVAQEARARGVRVGLEFLRSSELRSLAAAESLRSACGEKNVGHIIDALHLARAGDTPDDIAAVNSVHLFGLQICDAPRAAPPDAALREEIRNRLLPGEGGLPLKALVAAMPETLPVEIEAPHARHSSLSYAERARLAFAAAARFLACAAATEKAP